MNAPIVNVDLSGRKALVTGGVSGIGLACARKLAGAGAAVTIVDLSEEAAQQTADALPGSGHVGIGVDLSTPEGLDSLDDDRFRTDILVNNAGFQVVAPVHEYPTEVFTAIHNVLLHAPFRLIRASLPGMYERGWGRIVNISSAHGLIASPYKSGYISAKHGLEGLSKTVAMEAGGQGVTSNCINPGYVRTPLVEKQIADQAKTHGIGEDEVVEKIMLTRPSVKRLVEADEVADLAMFLCSDAAQSITGSSYRIDGGWLSN